MVNVNNDGEKKIYIKGRNVLFISSIWDLKEKDERFVFSLCLGKQ